MKNHSLLIAVLLLSLTAPLFSAESIGLGAQTRTEDPSGGLAEVIYRHPTKRPKDYEKFYLAPVILKLTDKNNALNADDQKFFSDAFTQAARESFANNKAGLTLVDKPAADVLTVQTEVSEFEAVKPEATGRGEIALRFDGSGRGGSLLLTALDGASNEKILVLRETLRGPKYLVGDQQKRMMNMLDAFRTWGSLLQQRLEMLKKQSNEGAK